MSIDFSRFQLLKGVAVFLAVVSVVLILGAVVSKWQAKDDMMPNGMPLPPPPPNQFYGYVVNPFIGPCVQNRIDGLDFKDKIKNLFVSKKALVDGWVAECEAEQSEADKELELLRERQGEDIFLADEEKERQANGVTLKELPVVTLPPFTVNWLSAPKKIDDISLLNASSYDEISYFDMGSTSSGDKLIYSRGEAGMMGTDIARWIETQDGKFVLLEKQSALSQWANLIFDSVAVANGKLSRDSVSEISGIDAPNEFEYLGTRWARQGGLFAPDSTPLDTNFEKPNHDLTRVSFGELVSKEKKNLENQFIGSVSYFVRIADGFYLNYKMDDSRADDGTLMADWKSKYENFRSLSFTGGSTNGGCGTVGDNRYYPKSGEIEGLEQVGTLKTGKPLYLVKDANNAVAGTFYSEYLSPLSYGNASPMSRSDFFKHITVLLSPDPFGQGYLFYKNIDDNTLIQGAECAKPVIYLYPEKTTNVSIKVGAHVTKSEPEYGSGWKVTVEPNGVLHDENGKKWQSLFWDGRGYGEYPTIREGHVVSRQNVRGAIDHDLTALGLNERERTDFLEFWMPHMPDAPYIRLSWLTTSEMNQLAPLAVSPQPDTIIRVFLDFSGQESAKTQLKPQTLLSIPRKGFTLVEWGGLLYSSKDIR